MSNFWKQFRKTINYRQPLSKSILLKKLVCSKGISIYTKPRKILSGLNKAIKFGTGKKSFASIVKIQLILL